MEHRHVATAAKATQEASSFLSNYRKLQQWLANHPADAPGLLVYPNGAAQDEDERGVGQFVSARLHFSDGPKACPYAKLLELLPGWDARRDIWSSHFAQLSAWFEEHGRRLPTSQSKDQLERKLALWLIQQNATRRSKKDDEL